MGARASKEKRRNEGDELGGWPDGLGQFRGWERTGDGMVDEVSEPASVRRQAILKRRPVITQRTCLIRN